jgi:hypothetical protein
MKLSEIAGEDRQYKSLRDFTEADNRQRGLSNGNGLPAKPVYPFPFLMIAELNGIEFSSTIAFGVCDGAIVTYPVSMLSRTYRAKADNALTSNVVTLASGCNVKLIGSDSDVVSGLHGVVIKQYKLVSGFSPSFIKNEETGRYSADWSKPVAREFQLRRVENDQQGWEAALPVFIKFIKENGLLNSSGLINPDILGYGSAPVTKKGTGAKKRAKTP